MTAQSLQKRKIKFLLLEGVHPSAVETLQQSGYSNIESHPKALPTEELKAASQAPTSWASGRAPNSPAMS